MSGGKDSLEMYAVSLLLLCISMSILFIKCQAAIFSREKIDLWNYVIIFIIEMRAKITCRVYCFASLPQVKYKENYEKDKGKADYNVLPASENPLLRQMMAAGNTLSDVSIFLSKSVCVFNLS